jgi:hypothetical protein
VVYKGTGDVARLADGKVRLQSESDPGLIVAGTINEDGSFVLGVFSQGKVLGEVPAGKYKVRVEPPVGNDDKPRRGLLHPKYQDYNKSGLSVTVPPPGEIILEVERPGG